MMRYDFVIIEQFVLIPILILFITTFVYGLCRKVFQKLFLGPWFFLLGLSSAGYFLIKQCIVYRIFGLYTPSPDNWIGKLFLFLLIFSSSIIVLKIADELLFNRYLRAKTHVRMPTLFRDILTFAILFIIVLVVLRVEFGFQLTGILTSSAIVSVIIGLALQDTLSNIISGIVLHVERPFKMGDWIKTGTHEGEVVEVSWRATRLRTLDGNYIVIPNNQISKEIILNYYEPTRAHAIVFYVGIEYSAAPAYVKELLMRAAQDCPAILKKPAPAIKVVRYGDFAIEYEIKIWIEDHSVYKEIQDEVMTKIWYRLNRARVKIPYPITTVHLEKENGQNADALNDPEVRKGFIQHVDVFHCMPESEVLEVARRSAVRHYTNGERIIVQGDAGQSLYVIVNGRVSISSVGESEREVFINELKEKDCFGEMSLLTGEKRTATIAALGEVTLIEIASSDLLPAIERNPCMMESLSQVLAERKLATQGAMDNAKKHNKILEKETLSKNLFSKIRDFFGTVGMKKIN